MQEGEDFPGPKVGVLSGRKGQSFRGTFFGRRTAAALPALAATALLANQIPTWLDARPTHIRQASASYAPLRSGTDQSCSSMRSPAFARDLQPASRRVDLTAGEAVFRVSKDATRPFRVHTNDAVIQAVGTQFNVNARSDMTIVTVIEGRVSVSSPSSDSAAGCRTQAANAPDIGWRADHSATQTDHRQSDPSRPGKSHRVDRPPAVLRRHPAQRSRPAIHSLQPTNHSHRRSLVGERRISGTFDSSDHAALVQFLERYGHTTAIKTDHGWTLDRAPPDDRH